MDIKKMRQSVYEQLKKVFGQKVNRQPYLKFIKLYYSYATDLEYVLPTITDVQIKKKKNFTEVMIETHRPGIVIGKMGKNVDGLKEYLELHTKENIRINLKECTLWHKNTK